MASARSKSRLKVGARVKVCVDHHTDILADMGLFGPGRNLLNDVWMFGTITATHPSTCTIDLPAAECKLSFKKEAVFLVKKDEQFPVVYVLFGERIQAVVGIQWSDALLPEDYYHTEQEAIDAVEEARSENGENPCSTNDSSASPVQPINQLESTTQQSNDDDDTSAFNSVRT